MHTFRVKLRGRYEEVVCKVDVRAVGAKQFEVETAEDRAQKQIHLCVSQALISSQQEQHQKTT